MANLYTHKSENIQRTWALMFAFLIFVIGVGWALSYLYESPTILYGAVGLSFVMNIWSYWNSDKLVLKLAGAREVDRKTAPELWNVTENLAITAGLPMPALYIVDDPSPNAFATGRNPEHAAVAATTGLLKILDRVELEGVIAHELSHVGNRDTLIQTVAVVLVGSLSLIADMFLRGAFFGGRSDSREGNTAFALLGLMLIILAPIAGTLMRLAISRNREYLADASGALLTRYPEGLARALEKIHAAATKQPLKNARAATAHMYIADPFGGTKRTISNLFATHPPVERRLQILREME